MPKAAHDWDICKNCTHTINIHTVKGVVGMCHAIECACEEYEKR